MVLVDERGRSSAMARPECALAVLAPSRVVVFRALQLGDLLCAVPALRALRQALPKASICLVGLAWARDFAARFADYVDEFLVFPGFPGLPEQAPDVRAWPAFLAAAHERPFDLSIQMHGNGVITNPVTALLGARVAAGFGAEAASGWFLPYPDHGPEPGRLLRLMRFLGAESGDERLEFPLRPDDEAAWDRYPAIQSLEPGRYLCVHAGARAPDRCWPASHFAAVADALAGESGLPVVLTGSAQEAALTRAVAAAMRHPAVDAAAPVPVGALAALISRCRLLVTNDTGTSHIAAALRVPSVVVFRASDMSRWAPADASLHRGVWDPAATRIGAVISEARSLLAQPAPPPPPAPRAPA